MFLNDLTDIIPYRISVSCPYGYHPIRDTTNVEIHSVRNKDFLELGVTNLKTAVGNLVRCYDSARMFCELIRRRGKDYDAETFVKGVRNFVKYHQNQIDQAVEYSKILKIEDKVMDLLEVLMNES